MTAVTLRPYQTELVDGVRGAMASGHRRVLAVLPTGGGKGRILAHIPASAAQRQRRTLIIAHRGELLDQISSNLDAEGVPHGRHQPGYSTRSEAVMIGMVQTVARRLDTMQPPDLVMIDEAHHAPAGQYRAITTAWPKARVIGVTATPVRGDGRSLSAEFDAMVIGPSTSDLIQAGHLAAYDYYLPSVDFSMDRIPIVRGDYAPGAALAAVTASHIVGDAVAHYRQYLGGRPAIAFCMGVQHARDTAAEFGRGGLRAASIDGEMHISDRRAVLAMLARGDLDVLTAADVVSEGVDIPAVAGAILLRPTASLALFLQQVGRSLRPKPDGSRAVILDHVGNARRHGFPADPRIWTLDGQVATVAPKLRTCGQCFRVFNAGSTIECSRSPCGLAMPTEATQREAILAMPGVLEAAVDPWAWAGGVDVMAARGDELASLMRAATGNRERLAMIQRARGYKIGWVWMQMQGKRAA